MKRVIAGFGFVLAAGLVVALAAGWGGAEARALLDVWHVPNDGQPPGHTMREPLYPLATEFPVSIWLGAVSAEPPAAAWLHYREFTQADWQTAAMALEVVDPGLQYWLAAIPGPFPAGSIIHYYFEAAASGADTTFVYGSDAVSETTADELQARQQAFSFQVLGPGTPTPPPTTPTPVPTGTPTPDVTPTPAAEVGCELLLNAELFTAGDEFRLRMSIWNQTAVPVEIAQFVVLDVFGQYWFWPAWTEDPDFRLGTLGGGQTFTDTILDFYWPGNAGSADGIRIWGALLDPSLTLTYGQIAQVQFAFR